MTWGSDAVKIYNTVKKHVNSREPFSLEFAVGTPKGVKKHIKAQAQIFSKIGADRLVMRGTIQDITTVKEAELVKEVFTKKLETGELKRTSVCDEMKAQLEGIITIEQELGDLKSGIDYTGSQQYRTRSTVRQP